MIEPIIGDTGVPEIERGDVWQTLGLEQAEVIVVDFRSRDRDQGHPVILEFTANPELGQFFQSGHRYRVGLDVDRRLSRGLPGLDKFLQVVGAGGGAGQFDLFQLGERGEGLDTVTGNHRLPVVDLLASHPGPGLVPEIEAGDVILAGDALGSQGVVDRAADHRDQLVTEDQREHDSDE